MVPAQTTAHRTAFVSNPRTQAGEVSLVPKHRFFCEAMLEIDVPERDPADVCERAIDERWELLGTLRVPVNARCAVLDLIGLDLVNLRFECAVDHAGVLAEDVCPARGFDPAIDCAA